MGTDFESWPPSPCLCTQSPIALLSRWKASRCGSGSTSGCTTMTLLSKVKRERAATLVEYAIVAPLLFLLLFAIIEFGIIVFSYDTISNAAREGARYGAVNPSDSAGIEAAARNLTTGLDQAALQINSTAGGQTVRVEVFYPVNLITSMIIQALGGNPTLDLRATATMYVE